MGASDAWGGTAIPARVRGYVFRGDRLGPVDEAPGEPPADGWWWRHLRLEELGRLDGEGGASWLASIGVPEEAVETLLARQTRPALRTFLGGMLFVGRGIPDDPSAPPDDTVSLRAWIADRILVTVALRPVLGPRVVAAAASSGDVPAGPAAALLRVVGVMTEGVAQAVEEVGDRVSQMGRDVIDESMTVTPSDLAPLRIRAITLHRYLVPLRAALGEFSRARCSWLTASDREEAEGLGQHAARLVEDIEAAQHRAGVARDEIVSQQGERMNRRLYGLTLLTAVFLPLGVLTGALGINVGGIPLADEPWAFPAVLGLFAVVVVVEVWALRRRGWL